MAPDHAFVPVTWDTRCGAIPGHPNGCCPAPWRCQHNRCMKPRSQHTAEEPKDRSFLLVMVALSAGFAIQSALLAWLAYLVYELTH